MKILVTGGTGYIGSHTSVLLLKKGAARIDADILENSQRGLETRVRIGEPVGRALR